MINYQILADSQKHYLEKGFIKIESPWAVSEAVSAITRPKGLVPYKLEHNGKCLVGSGEQSFLYMMTKGFLPSGRYQTITPCFRDESFDTLHMKYFMKNELIITDSMNDSNLFGLIEDALAFFRKYLKPSEVNFRRCSGGVFDIMWRDEYELGSYGKRKHDQLEWIYGTGVAEPRLSHIIKIATHASIH